VLQAAIMGCIPLKETREAEILAGSRGFRGVNQPSLNQPVSAGSEVFPDCNVHAINLPQALR
jgi:hypothetical protein